jgi:hypothetical protein
LGGGGGVDTGSSMCYNASSPFAKNLSSKGCLKSNATEYTTSVGKKETLPNLDRTNAGSKLIHLEKHTHTQSNKC